MNTEQINHIETLITALECGGLQSRDRDFAQSLVAGWQRYGSVTPRQAPYLEQLAQRVRTTQPTDSAALAGAKPVIDLLRHAGQHQKRPKLVFRLRDGSEVRFTIAGPKSKYPGSINVVGAYSEATGERPWYGRILESGEIHRSKQWHEGCEYLVRELCKDPAALAAKYGKKTGSCCFCARALTDDRSVGVGYGPICADRYGLPWGA